MLHTPTTRYRLAALDMDGTLLNTDHETSPFTRQALTRAAEAGKVIALCTGRCLSELWSHFAENPGVAYAISENGGCLYDIRAGRALSQLTIDADVAVQILEIISEYDACTQCFVDGQSYMQRMGEAALAPYHVDDFAPVFDAGSKLAPDMLALARSGGHVEKIDVYFARPDDKAAFWKRIEGFGLFVADSLGYGCEISPPEATKAEGLRRLCALLDIPVADAMGVGDGGNDVDLVRAAGLGVAMGNACEAVRAAAAVQTADNDHDGAARAVLRYMLGEDV